jgi:glutathione S-transferase
MSLELYFHPLSSYCHKVLIALYENGTPFVPRSIDLTDPEQRGLLVKLWPAGKFPVLRDTARGRTVPESTTIIEYLALNYPGPVELVPAEPELALEVRLRDRIFDLHVQAPMQKIVGDWIRPGDRRDPHGVEEARASLATALEIVEQEMRTRTWAVGERFTMADCAAAPALFYADKVMPLGEKYPHAAAYLGRLKERPSYARTLAEAQPYLEMFPM